MQNGDTYIQGGRGGPGLPELRDGNGVFRALTSADTTTLAYRYPRNFVAPDGRIFGFDAEGHTYYVTTGGTGTITMGTPLPGQTAWTSSPVMFQPGRILQTGGTSTSALIIDINGSTPVVTMTQPIAALRQWVTTTVLADGRVVATGGSAVENELTDVVNTAAIWNPDTGQWTQGSAGHLARLYHSTALMLPDATVLVAGGGAPGRWSTSNAEIYYPPYLFNSSGGFAARPEIDSAPTALDIGEEFRRQCERAERHRPRHADQDRLGHPQLQHGAALHGAGFHPLRGGADDPGPDVGGHCDPGLLSALRDRFEGRALGRQESCG